MTEDHSRQTANHIQLQASHYYENLTYAMTRPFAVMHPKLFIDGNQWCALHGDNLQDGVAGFGDSPEKAAIDFDRAFAAPLPSRS